MKFSVILILLCGSRTDLLQTHKFESEVSSGGKKSVCSFSLVLRGEEEVDIKQSNIKCSKTKKQMKIQGFSWTTGTMKKFTLSFTITRTKGRILSAAVETGDSS